MDKENRRKRGTSVSNKYEKVRRRQYRQIPPPPEIRHGTHTHYSQDAYNICETEPINNAMREEKLRRIKKAKKDAESQVSDQVSGTPTTN